jgi:hypothetical protein
MPPRRTPMQRPAAPPDAQSLIRAVLYICVPVSRCSGNYAVGTPDATDAHTKAIRAPKKTEPGGVRNIHPPGLPDRPNVLCV